MTKTPKPPTNDDPGASEKLPLAQAVEKLLEECRMVLPGLQALFGFQLIAVFNDAFSRRLGAFEQLAHLAAITLVAVAVALVMTPAAYHRQTRPGEVSAHFLRLSSQLLLFSMFPMAVAIGVDLYLIARLITERSDFAAAIALAVLAAYFGLWLILPWWRRRQDRRSERERVG
jgi:hypothetical protein